MQDLAEVDDGRKLRRALVRNAHRGPDAFAARVWRHVRGDSELHLQDEDEVRQKEKQLGLVGQARQCAGRC
jgi:type IV secretory pathway VirD2 relaxase